MRSLTVVLRELKINASVQTRTHWKQLVNPKFLGVSCLPNSQDLTVTIRSVGLEVVIGDGGKKEECTVAQLIGSKPIILNHTNYKTIEKMYGPYLEDWARKSMTVYESSVKIAGEIVACLRIRQHLPNEFALTQKQLNQLSMELSK